MHIHSDIPKATKKYFTVALNTYRISAEMFTIFIYGYCLLFFRKALEWFYSIFLCFWWLQVIAFYSGSFSFGLSIFCVSFWKKNWNFDGEKCPWKMFFGKKIKPHRPHAHKRSLAVKDETHFGFMAMAITFVCLVTARKKHRAQYTNRKKPSYWLLFDFTCIINQTDHRCAIFFAFILLQRPTTLTTLTTLTIKNDKAHWRRKRFVLWSRFTNLIIFSFRSNRWCVCSFFVTTFSLILFGFCSSLFSDTHLFVDHGCNPDPYQIPKVGGGKKFTCQREGN